MWRGRGVFYKRYPGAAHFASELQALDLLRRHAPPSFHFVDRLDACPATHTIVFPRFLMDTSAAASASPHPEAVVDAVCLQVVEELAVVRALPEGELTLRAADPWHFLLRVEARLEAQDREVIRALPCSDDHVVFRYDPQLDNFLVTDTDARAGVWSTDFSMWRRVHVGYPFAFLWHDLCERPRPRLDPERLRTTIAARYAAWASATGRDPARTGVWLVAGRAEALAHELDGHTRRGSSAVAGEKLVTLTRTLKELRTLI
jgi:hypothetical protein